jgi:hypothetical protein
VRAEASPRLCWIEPLMWTDLLLLLCWFIVLLMCCVDVSLS